MIEIEAITGFFAGILSFIIYPIYELVENYGLAVILFTVIVKIVLFPLGIKQQKTTFKTKMLRPELEKIQAKYKNDKEKLNEETMKLYQKYDVNPMGGCLPLLVQLPILLGLYSVIQKPIAYILRKTPSDAIMGNAEKGIEGLGISLEEAAKKIISLFPEDLASVEIGKLADLGELIEMIPLKFRDAQITIASAFDLINFDFLGLDLSKTPDIRDFSYLWIIPFLATAAGFFSNWVSQKLNPMSPEQAQQMRMMNLMMPLMTAFFTFTLPAGVGLYWFVSTMLSVLQMVLLTKYFERKYPSEGFVKEKKGKGKNK